MKFEYSKFPGIPTEPFPDRRYALRPVLPITVKKNGKDLKYHAIVDSGADHNIFHAQIGEFLGIDIKTGKKLNFWGTGGQQQVAYFHDVVIEIGGWDFKCYCGFSYDINILPYGLLGQDDFFKQFKVIFDYSKCEFELRPCNR
jgi:hypothetical protein